nr:hypothetical protein [Tanacetum cinerariifolium]
IRVPANFEKGRKLIQKLGPVRQDNIAAVLILVVTVLEANLMGAPQQVVFVNDEHKGHFDKLEVGDLHHLPGLHKRQRAGLVVVAGFTVEKPAARFHFAKAYHIEIRSQRRIAKRAMQQLLAREQAQQRMLGRRIPAGAVKLADALKMSHGWGACLGR